MPAVDNLDRGRRHDHEANVRGAIAVATRCLTIVHNRIPNRPGAVMDEAAVAPTPADPKASWYRHSLSRRVDASSQSAMAITENLTHDVVREIAR
jgi:hypothetical protein